MVLTLMASWVASAETPRTKVMTTKASTPPSEARPPTHHQRRRDTRGTPEVCSRCPRHPPHERSDILGPVFPGRPRPGHHQPRPVPGRGESGKEVCRGPADVV